MLGKYLNVILGFAVISSLLFFNKNRTLQNLSLKTCEGDKNNAYENAKNISQKNALDTAAKYREWLQKNGYSTRLLFLADMKLSMELKRFYVINLDSNKILNTFLVAHGSGKGSTADSAVCSNQPGSLCSSLGKYSIFPKDTLWGEYGKGYWMNGLDKTNNNARKRLIVFHYYIPQTTEEFGERNFFSSGCPMLAQSSFRFCDSLLRLETKPVLMHLYR